MEHILPSRSAPTEREEFHQLLADHAQDIVGLNHVDGRRLYVSPSYYRVTGWTEEEIRTTDWRTRMHPDDLALVEGTRAANLRGERTVIEHRVRCKDGAWLWLETQCKPLAGPDGEVERMVLWSRNITPRKQAELAAKEVLDRLHKIASNVPGVVYQFRLRPDGSSCFPFASEAIREIYRVSPESVREDASGVFAVLHPEDYDRIVASIQESAHALTPWHLEYRVKFADGTVRWLLGDSLPQREADGCTLWHGFITDITPRKLAELAGIEARAALAASESRLRAIFDGEPECVKLLAEDGSLLEMNPAGLRMIQADSFEQVGHLCVYSLIAAEHRAAFRELNARTFAGESGSLQFQIVGLKGRRLWLETHASPLRDATGLVTAQLSITRDITERTEAEAKYRAIFEHAVEGIFQSTPGGRFLTVNPALARILGFASPEELMEQRTDMALQGYVRPEEREEFKRRLAAHGSVSGFEYESFRKDGSRLWLSESARAVHDAAGRIAYYEGTIEDITQRKQAQQRLAAFAKLGRQLNSIQHADAAARIIVSVADDLLGWHACTLSLYEPWSDRCNSLLCMDLINGQRREVPPAYVAGPPSTWMRRALQHGAELLLREEPLTMSLAPGELPFGDTSRPSASLMIAPLRDGQQAIGALSIQSYRFHAYTPEDLETLQALADHCGGALARIQARLALGETERRFRLVWESAVDGMRLTDAQGRIVAANAAYCRMMGRPQHEVEGESMADVYAEPERARILTRHRERFAKREVPEHLERQMTLWDGRTLWLDASNCLVETDPSRPLLLSILRDITPSKQMQDQLHQSQKMEAIGQLAGGIAHDFNNILGAILGNVELAKTMPPGDPALHESLDAIFNASRRAADLVYQILAFSRQQEQERQPLQLHLVVKEALKLLRATVPASIEFRATLASTAIVLADRTQIHSVVMNLGINAWHAMQGRPGTLTVDLAETVVDADFAQRQPDLRPGRYVRLAISDTGCGMAAATVSRIFEPFFTTKEVGKGTGLGLSVVHGIMKSHDGSITVASQTGVGTVFELYFPAFATGVTDAAPDPEPLPRGRGEHILFVDDEEPLVLLGQRLLERLGYRVTVHANPLEAAAAIQAQPAEFDVVITDLNMPILNGMELAERMLAIRPGLPIILTTGYNASLTDEFARVRGFRELLLKPYDMREVGNALQRALAGPKETIETRG
ncbi:MAG: PAS domain S-box protein [Verrucomicrobia bacterium]|nr:PAS domain S-box protein [Verrucomicrobiota bacterium]